MSEPARKLEVVEEPKSVTQYWLCTPTDPDRREAHVYPLDDGTFAVNGYLANQSFAMKACGVGRKVAEVVVHQYDPLQLHAHKKHFTFKRWILDRIPKKEDKAP